ncbi:MmpS family transport accessory protein, partial [Mycobacterium tuberculosis]
MFGVAKRFWIPMVIVIVVAVAAVTVSRLHSVFGSHQHAPDTGNLDPIIAFYPKHVLYEVFGPPGTVLYTHLRTKETSLQFCIRFVAEIKEKY